MNPDIFLSIDIGSTFTKGIVCQKKDQQFDILMHEQVPTTPQNLMDCFLQLLKKFHLNITEIANGHFFFSSSAKGGLKISAVGIVPELTLKVAQQASFSAGAKVVSNHSYKLSEEDLSQLIKAQPDIILFCGGTDGGNESYVLHNAKILSQLNTNPMIIFAGNQAVKDKVQDILANKNLIFSKNILPSLDQSRPEIAHEIIRDQFLNSIIYAKGLNQIVEQAGEKPLPTPYVMLNLIQCIGEKAPAWDSFGLIDLGGATTDIYSFHTQEITNSFVVYRGLTEPKLKRTVEGDLGIRINAENIFEYYKNNFQLNKDIELSLFEKYLEKLKNNHDTIPQGKQEQKFDQILSSVAIKTAIQRHSGTIKTIYTPQGEAFLQKGKDLRKLKRMIGTGGFLSRQEKLNLEHPCQNISGEEQPLIPQHFEYFVDQYYLLPLIANLSFKYPHESVQSVLKFIEKRGIADGNFDS